MLWNKVKQVLKTYFNEYRLYKIKMFFRRMFISEERDVKKSLDYEDIDSEIRYLIRTLNKVKGLYTISCCSGHCKEPCKIYFKVESWKVLHNFLFYVLDCNKSWKLIVDTSDVNRKSKFNKQVFCLEFKYKNDIELCLEVECFSNLIRSYIA